MSVFIILYLSRCEITILILINKENNDKINYIFINRSRSSGLKCSIAYRNAVRGIFA